MPLMLVVLMSVSLIVTVAMQRQGAQTRVIQRQINEYRLRHDMHGVKAIVQNWIKNVPRGALGDYAETPEAAHVFELPSGARAIVRVTQGQGLPLRGGVGVDDELVLLYHDMLDRLRLRPDLTRGVGPWQISVAGSPREVLEAMVSKSGPSFADEIIRMRQHKDGLNRSAFSQLVSTLALEGEDRRFVTRAVVFDSTLWKITVETQDWSGKRRYDMLVERSSSGTTVHEWIEYTEAELRAMERGDSARRDR